MESIKRPEKPLSECRILVVDDEPDLREIIAFDFESAGHPVETAHDGLDALKHISSGRIDAIVSDIRMPRSDGIALLKEVKKSGDGDCPVMIFITGYSDLSIEDAYNLGIDGFFSKPFDRRLLVQTISRLMTPTPERWLKPSKLEVVNEGECVIQKFSSLESALAGNYLSMGRGGMFVAKSGSCPTMDRLVPFRIEFEDGKAPLVGTGFVRWSRSSPRDSLRPGFGLEFESLSGQTYQTVSELLAQLKASGKTKAFIPNG